MRPIATDTNDFPSLRGDGKIYVDKTMFIHRLVIGLSFDSSTRRLSDCAAVRFEAEAPAQSKAN